MNDSDDDDNDVTVGGRGCHGDCLRRGAAPRHGGGPGLGRRAPARQRHEVGTPDTFGNIFRSYRISSFYKLYKINTVFIFSGGRYSDGEDEEEEEDGEYQDEETVEQFEDRVLNKRAGKVEDCTFFTSNMLNVGFVQLHYRMRALFENTASLTYSDLAKRKDTKKDAAQKFYSLLVLQKVGVIRSLCDRLDNLTSLAVPRPGSGPELHLRRSEYHQGSVFRRRHQHRQSQLGHALHASVKSAKIFIIMISKDLKITQHSA